MCPWSVQLLCMHSIPGLLTSKTPCTDLSLSQAIRAGFPCQLAGFPALFPYRWAVRDWERAFLVYLPNLFQSMGSVHCLSGLESRMWLLVLWRRTASWERVTRCQLWASGSAYPVKLSLKQRQEPAAVTLPSSRDPNPPLITLSTQKHSLPIPLCVPVASWSLQLARQCKRAVERRSGDSWVLLGTKETKPRVQRSRNNRRYNVGARRIKGSIYFLSPTRNVCSAQDRDNP